MSKFIKLNIIYLNWFSKKFENKEIYINASFIIGFSVSKIPKIGQTEEDYFRDVSERKGTLIRIKKDEVVFIDGELERPERSNYSMVGIESGDPYFFIEDKAGDVFAKLEGK